ncbi:MAG TPA: ABC transporter ATP-binding protein [Ktedonobacterales bacterium]|nr:ABC transporter ATP-binding protein [Ktedonobacterales bacterium]
MTDVIHIEHITKTYEGVDQSLRGTKLEWKGPALWLRNLAKATRLTSSAAPPVHALSDVSLTVRPGEVFGLVGPNGSGKTTLIKILAGLIRPTTGDGKVAGISLDNPQEIRKRVSYVSTTGWMGLEWPLTAEENVRFFATLCGMPSSLARVRTEGALRDVELWEDRGKYPSQLSNGMRQRVILARALLFRTPLVLLDEPTVGLDPLTARALLELIRGPLRARGQTILLTDHQSAEMESVADRIAVLGAGAIALLGTPAGLRARLSHVTVIEVHTEEMDLPTRPRPASVVASEYGERPGPLEVRAWRIQVHRSPEAFEAVLAWVTQPTGRVVFLAESEPTLQDALMLPADLIEAPHTSTQHQEPQQGEGDEVKEGEASRHAAGHGGRRKVETP